MDLVRLATLGIVGAAGLEGELLYPPGSQETLVRLQDLAEEGLDAAGSVLRHRGVAVLRPGLAADDVVGKDFLRRELQRDDVTSAMSRLLRPDSRLFTRLGFGSAWCGEFRTRRSSPREQGQEPPPWASLPTPGSVSMLWLRLLRYVPWLGRVLKVVLSARVPVQPVAVRTDQEAAGGDWSTWWWHSLVGEGDVIVLDHLRTLDSPVTLPGESSLHLAGKAARSLREALRQGSPEGAFEVCESLADDILDPVPYPAVGRQYTVQSLPSTLIRREESVESDVIGELRPGSMVSILARGAESPGRVEVFTEQAMRMPGYVSDEGASAPTSAAGLKGWISSEAYNGTRLLKPKEPVEVPPATMQRLAELSGALRGICSWANVTLASATGPTWRTEQICKRHVGTLEQMLLKSEHLSIEVMCVSLEPWETHQLVALAMTGLMLLLGTLVLEKRGPPDAADGGLGGAKCCQPAILRHVAAQCARHNEVHAHLAQRTGRGTKALGHLPCHVSPLFKRKEGRMQMLSRIDGCTIPIQLL
ncbi:unnamed protein product [Symbiodinium natans]|uniref:Uncharacterized protein n=1 Tax=Symbiodinium natans TaxID=878477 RepID=A0A812RKM9_9DINO|nr:unnamed protein product [Symbiodinium natans]